MRVKVKMWLHFPKHPKSKIKVSGLLIGSWDKELKLCGILKQIVLEKMSIVWGTTWVCANSDEVNFLTRINS